MQNFKPSFSFLDFDPNVELLNHFPDLNPSVLDNPNLNFQGFMGFSNDNFLVQQAPEFPGNLIESFPGIFYPDDKSVVLASEPIVSAGSDFHESKKRKAMDVSESSSGNSSPLVSENGIKRKNVRRGKINEKLRCLQDIVPGCYKSMGMAVMLDEIINYVQSLQNQVEFLSMKLTAASSIL
ncbi:hypothetical protein F0562_023787 [Nyssa sinensis]|uniref:BHLH domain-containing protein n=1 Tax=Nyssa sinensis TaxID=561372 RepID=A0A5J5BJ18_9ASTE|nr:hypothetical protein F0562_023787 [Nyssa sinensis]